MHVRVHVCTQAAYVCGCVCAVAAPWTVALHMPVSLAKGETGDRLGLATLVPGILGAASYLCPPAAIHSGFWPTLAL